MECKQPQHKSKSLTKHFISPHCPSLNSIIFVTLTLLLELYHYGRAEHRSILDKLPPISSHQIRLTTPYCRMRRQILGLPVIPVAFMICMLTGIGSQYPVVSSASFARPPQSELDQDPNYHRHSTGFILESPPASTSHEESQQNKKHDKPQTGSWSRIGAFFFGEYYDNPTSAMPADATRTIRTIWFALLFAITTPMMVRRLMHYLGIGLKRLIYFAFVTFLVAAWFTLLYLEISDYMLGTRSTTTPSDRQHNDTTTRTSTPVLATFLLTTTILAVLTTIVFNLGVLISLFSTVVSHVAAALGPLSSLRHT